MIPKQLSRRTMIPIPAVIKKDDDSHTQADDDSHTQADSYDDSQADDVTPNAKRCIGSVELIEAEVSATATPLKRLRFSRGVVLTGGIYALLEDYADVTSSSSSTLEISYNPAKHFTITSTSSSFDSSGVLEVVSSSVTS